MSLGVRIVAALVTALVLSLTAAGPGAPPLPQPPAEAPVDPPPAPAAEIDPRVARAATTFSIDLLKQVHQGRNTFLSPTSAALVLSLAANGARGETQQALLQALRFSGLTIDEVNQGAGALRTILANPDPKVQVAVANGIWHQRGLTPAAAFLQQARADYGAEVAAVDFGTPAATQAINDWVATQTRSRIPRLFDQTSPDEVMILVNALWFKGTWARPFDPQLTRERPFTRPDGTVKQVPLMHQSGYWSYLKADGIQLVRIPYGQGRVALYVLMPDRWDGFVAGLTSERWESLLAQIRHQQAGTVALPKVKLEYQAELLQPLAAMGMGPALGPGADFSGLFEGGVAPAIGRVVQKTFLEINEEGTEAAAATGVGMVTSAPANPFEMIVDRPFLLAIRDDRTGVLLFVGAIVEP